jgi:hypothetical protein
MKYEVKYDTGGGNYATDTIEAHFFRVGYGEPSRLEFYRIDRAYYVKIGEAALRHGFLWRNRRTVFTTESATLPETSHIVASYQNHRVLKVVEMAEPKGGKDDNSD